MSFKYVQKIPAKYETFSADGKLDLKKQVAAAPGVNFR